MAVTTWFGFRLVDVPAFPLLWVAGSAVLCGLHLVDPSAHPPVGCSKVASIVPRCHCRSNVGQISQPCFMFYCEFYDVFVSPTPMNN